MNGHAAVWTERALLYEEWLWISANPISTTLELVIANILPSPAVVVSRRRLKNRNFIASDAKRKNIVQNRKMKIDMQIEENEGSRFRLVHSATREYYGGNVQTISPILFLSCDQLDEVKSSLFRQILDPHSSKKIFVEENSYIVAGQVRVE
uniref:Uncharacterized protein n=1 Tax=Romanomermis culicivorax TaxID=13658 RepID=A0A915KA91_ROMCU